MAARFDSVSFEKKLRNIDASQNSIQTLSLWIIHHSKHSKQIASIWHGFIKQAPANRRLVLFYLANDVVQNSRKKNKDLVSAFGKVILASLPLLSDAKIKPNVDRVLSIWEERKIYNSKFIQQLKGSTDDGPSVRSRAKPPSNATAKRAVEEHPAKVKKVVPPDFKLPRVLNHIKKMKDLDADISLKSRKLSMLKVDASDLEAVKQVKDRSGVDKFVQEFEESKLNLDEYCKILNRSISEKKYLLDQLKDTDAFFENAMDDAKVIVNAYKTFGSRLNTIKRKLDVKVKKIEAAEIAAKEAAEKEEEEAEKNAAKASEEEAQALDVTIDKIAVEDMDLGSDTDDEDANETAAVAPEDEPGTVSSTADASTAGESQSKREAFVFDDDDDVPSPVSSSDESVTSPVGTPEDLQLDDDMRTCASDVSQRQTGNSLVVSSAPSLITFPPNFPTMPGIPLRQPIPVVPSGGAALQPKVEHANVGSPPGSSTPVLDEGPEGQPLDEDEIAPRDKAQKPLTSILDSLFPMLSKSLQTIRDTEAARSSPGSQSSPREHTPHDRGNSRSPDRFDSQGEDSDASHGSSRPSNRKRHRPEGEDTERGKRHDNHRHRHNDHARHDNDSMQDGRPSRKSRSSASPPRHYTNDDNAEEQRRLSVAHLQRVHDSIVASSNFALPHAGAADQPPIVGHMPPVLAPGHHPGMAVSAPHSFTGTELRPNLELLNQASPVFQPQHDYRPPPLPQQFLSNAGPGLALRPDGLHASGNDGRGGQLNGGARDRRSSTDNVYFNDRRSPTPEMDSLPTSVPTHAVPVPQRRDDRRSATPELDSLPVVNPLQRDTTPPLLDNDPLMPMPAGADHRGPRFPQGLHHRAVQPDEDFVHGGRHLPMFEGGAQNPVGPDFRPPVRHHLFADERIGMGRNPLPPFGGMTHPEFERRDFPLPPRFPMLHRRPPF